MPQPFREGPPGTRELRVHHARVLACRKPSIVIHAHARRAQLRLSLALPRFRRLHHPIKSPVGRRVELVPHGRVERGAAVLRARDVSARHGEALLFCFDELFLDRVADRLGVVLDVLGTEDERVVFRLDDDVSEEARLLSVRGLEIARLRLSPHVAALPRLRATLDLSTDLLGDFVEDVGLPRAVQRRLLPPHVFLSQLEVLSHLGDERGALPVDARHRLLEGLLRLGRALDLLQPQAAHVAVVRDALLLAQHLALLHVLVHRHC
mmetsp:Transcript_15217/g.32516  ORF Transcript_15217/g.32516 Transcript_15217/m.32516 type:complete len:265 (+) Transcript_15217:186-980(+)